jgi:hypothetical protein
MNDMYGCTTIMSSDHEILICNLLSARPLKCDKKYCSSLVSKLYLLMHEVCGDRDHLCVLVAMIHVDFLMNRMCECVSLTRIAPLS